MAQGVVSRMCLRRVGPQKAMQHHGAIWKAALKAVNKVLGRVRVRVHQDVHSKIELKANVHFP